MNDSRHELPDHTHRPGAAGLRAPGRDRATRPAPFAPTGRAKARLLARIAELGRRLEDRDEVVKVTTFDGVVFAPPTSYVRRHDSVHRARFDVVVLIETTSPAVARELRGSAEYQAVENTLRAAATDLHAFTARAPWRIGALARKGAIATLLGVAPTIAFMQPWNVLGAPAAAFPVGHVRNGHPIGLQICAPWGAERTLLALTAQLERHRARSREPRRDRR